MQPAWLRTATHRVSRTSDPHPPRTHACASPPPCCLLAACIAGHVTTKHGWRHAGEAAGVYATKGGMIECQTTRTRHRSRGCRHPALSEAKATATSTQQVHQPLKVEQATPPPQSARQALPARNEPIAYASALKGHTASTRGECKACIRTHRHAHAWTHTPIRGFHARPCCADQRACALQCMTT